MAKHKMNQQRVSHPLAPMLVGSFASELENRFAEMNNLLALQGITTSDPLAVALSGIRRGARELGLTFERVTPGTAVVAPTKMVTTAAKAAAPKPAVVATVTAREITESQIAQLQVPGSVSEMAPYGTDVSGAPLAPYGIKNNGVPKLRRGLRKGQARGTRSASASAPSSLIDIGETEEVTLLPEVAVAPKPVAESAPAAKAQADTSLLDIGDLSLDDQQDESAPDVEPEDTDGSSSNDVSTEELDALLDGI